MNQTLEAAISYLSTDDRAKVRAAFEFADEAHKGQTRKSGDPYIVHALLTATELAHMQMDATCLMAGILHDVPEDTHRTLEDINRKFGKEVTQLVNGVTKLGRVRLRTKEEQQASNLRKMFLAMAEDVRVIIIKLCDRLHNMRTIEALPRAKQRGIASETLEIYAPLANRLGMAEIRFQLEDLAFKCLQPKLYNTISMQLKSSKTEREHKLETQISRLENELTAANIMARVYGRSKHLYSIYQNVFVKSKENSIADVLDQLGVRIIVHDIKDCYQTLGLVHRIWRPIVGRFKDYIAIPKSNGYQSLHTGVICEDGSKLEIQIRTEEMDFTAEYGMAAHWRYKGDGADFDSQTQERMNWIHQLIDWQKEFHTAFDFVESLKLDLFDDQIFVFTPRGDVVDLPKDATPVDFAYRVHSDLGHNALGGKVNGRMVPLNYKLHNGDIIEILRSSHRRGPSRDWLEFVKTNTARSRIRSWFKKQQYDENVTQGKKRLAQELVRICRVELDTVPKETVEKIASELSYLAIDDMWAAVGYGAVNLSQLIAKFNKYLKDTGDSPSPMPSSMVPVLRKSQSTQLKIKGTGDLLTKIAPCCEPLPGDKIVGFITRGRGITVHRISCKNLNRPRREEPQRVIPLEWEQDVNAYFETTIKLNANDRSGFLKDIMNTIAEHNVFVSAFTSRSDDVKGTFYASITMRITDINQLTTVMKALENMPGVSRVERQT